MPILKAGSIGVLYEDGFIRYFKAGNTEVLRMIYFALRDENWATFRPWIENENVTSTEDSFQITYTCRNKKDDRTILLWKVFIEGKSNGTITFEIQGDVEEDLWKNRAGFCVLHPIDENITGHEVEIIHPNGKTSSSKFPIRIDPENPFKNIRQMRWHTANTWFRLDFEGDIFETEDQRNWTDASFKTFCTPSHLPIPALLKRGDTIHQKVVFSPETTIRIASSNDTTIPITKANEITVLPALGIGAGRYEVTDAVAQQFKRLPFQHYRVDIRFKDANWVSKFSFDCVNAVKLNLRPEVVLHLTENYKSDVESFTMLCLQNRLTIESVLLLQESKPATPQAIIDYSPVIKQQLSNVKIGAGTDFNFTEFNRNRFDPKGLDFVAYSIQPQEHAFDDRSIIETLEAQAETVRSTKEIYPTLPIHISAVTLKKRSLPFEKQIDERQASEFNASWTLGSIKHLADAGAQAVTYFEVMGPLGIVGNDGNPYPVAEGLAFLKGKDSFMPASFRWPHLDI